MRCCCQVYTVVTNINSSNLARHQQQRLGLPQIWSISGTGPDPDAIAACWTSVQLICPACRRRRPRHRRSPGDHRYRSHQVPPAILVRDLAKIARSRDPSPVPLPCRTPLGLRPAESCCWVRFIALNKLLINILFILMRQHEIIHNLLTRVSRTGRGECVCVSLCPLRFGVPVPPATLELLLIFKMWYPLLVLRGVFSNLTSNSIPSYRNYKQQTAF